VKLPMGSIASPGEFSRMAWSSDRAAGAAFMAIDANAGRRRASGATSAILPLELRGALSTINEVRTKARCRICGSREWIDAELFHCQASRLIRSISAR
jgi:hypothetical protein